VFHPVAAPESSDLQQLVEQIAARIGRALERRGLDVGGETDGAVLWWRRIHEFSDGREDGGDRLVVVLELDLEFLELASQSGVRGEEFSQLHEGAHDVDSHGDGTRGIEDVGGLDRTMFCESVWPILDVLAATTLQGRNLRP